MATSPSTFVAPTGGNVFVLPQGTWWRVGAFLDSLAWPPAFTKRANVMLQGASTCCCTAASRQPRGAGQRWSKRQWSCWRRWGNEGGGSSSSSSSSRLLLLCLHLRPRASRSVLPTACAPFSPPGFRWLLLSTWCVPICALLCTHGACAGQAHVRGRPAHGSLLRGHEAPAEVCVRACMCMSMRARACVRVHVCVCVCMCVHVHTLVAS